jgi:F-type H+-transporting ATPase subunit b
MNARAYRLRLLLTAALLGASLAFVAPASAQEPERAVAAAPEGGSASPGGHEEEEAQGIVNWWSWDYGDGAKDPAHKHWPPPFGFALINFFIFLGVMGRLAWKPLQKFVRDRHDGIAKDLDAAAKLRAEAEAQLKQYEAKIAGINVEIDTLLAQIHKEAEQEKARIIAAAEADAKRLRDEAERQIQTEIEAARRELRRGVIEAAVTAADEALKKNIAADDQRKMAERYVADVEQQAKHGRAS